MKKNLLFGLAAVTLLWSFTSCGDLFRMMDPTYGWYNSSSNDFTISNVTELQGLANIVRGNTGSGGPKQSDFMGKTITLTSDIDMTGQAWDGIGYSYLPTPPFNGTFDGNNKTISNVTMGGQGFFGLIGEYGTVKNLAFDTVTIDGADGGACVARTNEGAIQNVSVTNGKVSGIPGGIVYSNRGTIEKCSFSGSISGSAGGGIANGNAGVIRNCYVTGSITGGFTSRPGGIAGSNNGGTVEYCYAANSVSSRDGIVGGIVAEDGTVRNCVALNPSLSVSGNTNAGRISYFSPTLGNNYARSDMTLPSGVTVTSSANGIHGQSVSSSSYATQSWWSGTVGFNFTTVWEWDASKKLPVLR